MKQPAQNSSPTAPKSDFNNADSSKSTKPKRFKKPAKSKQASEADAVKDNEATKGSNKASKATKIPAPPEHKQRLLINVLREHLDVINVYKLGKAMDRVSQVRHFVEKSGPFIDGKDWIMFKAVLAEEARIMTGFLKEFNKIKNQI
jgi:hypothetical protein